MRKILAIATVSALAAVYSSASEAQVHGNHNHRIYLWEFELEDCAYMQDGFTLRGVKIGKTEDGTQTICRRHGVDPRGAESQAAIGRCRDYLSDMERSTACKVRSASIIAVAVLRKDVEAGEVERAVHEAMSGFEEVMSMRAFALDNMVPPMIVWEAVEGKAGQNEVFLHAAVADRARRCLRPTAGTGVALEAAVLETTRGSHDDRHAGSRQRWVHDTMKRAAKIAEANPRACEMTDLYDHQRRLVQRAFGAIASQELSIVHVLQPIQARQHANEIRQHQDHLARIEDPDEANQYFDWHLSVFAAAPVHEALPRVREQLGRLFDQYSLAYESHSPHRVASAESGAGAAAESSTKRARIAKDRKKK